MPYANMYPPTIKDFSKKKSKTLVNCGKCNRVFDIRFGIPCDNFGMCHKYLCRYCRPLIKTPPNVHYYCNECAPHFQFQTQQASSEQILIKLAMANDFRVCGDETKANDIELDILNELRK